MIPDYQIMENARKCIRSILSAFRLDVTDCFRTQQEHAKKGLRGQSLL